MSSSNSYKYITNIIWNFFEKTFARFVTFFVTIILARLLDPSVYGEISLVAVFISILNVFVDSGMANSLIQKKDVDQIDYSSVFYFNLFICIFLYTIAYILSPLVSQFYNLPRLTPVIRVLSLTIVISGVKNVLYSYVSKNLIFKKFFIATSFGTVISSIIGIYLAVNGFGIWALVFQSLSNNFIDTIILWFIIDWKPSFVFSIDRIKFLFCYGWKLFISSLIDIVYNNFNSLIIGKFYSMSDLAYYNKAKSFPNLIVNNVVSSIDGVLFPVMSNIQDDKKLVLNCCRRSIKLSTYIIMPILFSFAACSNTFVRLVLTDKWLQCVPYVFVFCFIYSFYPVHTVNLNAIKSLGRSDIFLLLEIIKKVIGLIIMIVALNISLKALMISLIILSFINQILNSFPNKSLLNYTYINQMIDILPNFILSILVFIFVFAINVFNVSLLLKMIIQIFVGILSFILLSFFLKNESFIYLLKIIYNRFGFKIFNNVLNKI